MDKFSHIPFVNSTVAAGFPSPIGDDGAEKLNLNHRLINHPAATYFLRVKGDSMKDAGIIDGDFLVVDRSLKIENNQIIVVEQDGELVVRRFKNANNQICLMPENEKYRPVFLRSPENLVIWGSVSAVFRKL